MAADVVIRDAAPEDAPVIQSIIERLARDTAGPDAKVLTVDEVRRHGFGPDRDFYTLIAETGGEPVGIAVYFTEFSTWRGRRGVYLQDIYVAPEAQGAGVGRRLIEALAARAKGLGAVYVRLAVDRSNEAGAAFYQRLGFEEVEKDRMFVLEGDPFNAAVKSQGSKR